MEHVGSVDGWVMVIITFPLEISGDSSFEEDLDELATAHDVLGDEVDVPIPVVAQLLGALLAVLE